MSDTPRTDEECGDVFGDAYFRKVPVNGEYVPVDLCRSIELELNAFVRLVLGDEAALTPSGNVVLAVAKLKSDLEELAQLRAEAVKLQRKLAEVEVDRDSWAEQADQRATDAVQAMNGEDAWKEYAGRLEEAGDCVQGAVVGTEGMSHWQWLALAHEADLKWRKAKETKP